MCLFELWVSQDICPVVRRRRWHPTPVLLLGKSHGWRSLVGCSPWGHEKLDTTERLYFHFSLSCIGEGNGNPLQCSCLEKSQGRGSLVGCRLWGHTELDTTERLPFHFSLSCIGEGNGNPVYCSCLENPGDGGAWWAAVYEVAQSRTRLKRLSSSDSSWLISEKEMAPHSRILAWRIPGTGEPGGLLSMG